MTSFVQVGGLRIAFDRQGEGPPLLLMHGAEASRQMFSALMPHLAGHFTVIAYDQRDCGDTDGPEAGSTLADLADDAQQLIDALGLGRAHVFGSSFGGRVAQALALRHPHAVDRLALGSTWPLPDAYEARCPDAPRLAALRRQLPATAEELATWFFPEDFLLQRPELRRVFANARPESARSARRAATVRTTLDRDIVAIAAPTLLLAGELDRVVPPGVTLSMVTRMQYATAVELPGIGHATALQAPELLAPQLVRFLRGHPYDKE
jgi:pimeloyl-ACP methyl ester carboxylesterase